MSKTGQRGFRPHPEVQKRLEFAEQRGLNVSEIINEVLAKGLKQHLEQKMRQIRETLSVPVP